MSPMEHRRLLKASVHFTARRGYVVPFLREIVEQRLLRDFLAWCAAERRKAH